MNDEQTPINVMLSREELLVALRLLEAETIPGLDPDPEGTMSTEQQELALVVAARALRARGLARVDEEGNLALHQGVLTAVGTAAYAQNSLFGLHWSGGGGTPLRYFAHLRADDVVSHRRPEDVLHLWTVLPTVEALLAQFYEFCEFADAAADDAYECHMPADTFIAAREAGQAGDAAAGTAVLTAAGVAEAAAQALSATLSGAPRITIAQTLQQMSDGVQKRDFTLLQTEQQSWLLIPAISNAEAPTFLAKTTDRAEVTALLTDSLKVLVS